MIQPLILDLPWGPSVNHYWKSSGKRRYRSAEAINYCSFVCLCFKASKHPGFGSDNRLKLDITAYPKDRRKSDLDNRLKGILDSLQYAGVYADDFQIDEIHIKRMPQLDGLLIVEVSCL